LPPLLLAVCASAPAYKPGNLAVFNIPKKYINGTIIISAKSKTGDSYHYHFNTLRTVKAAALVIEDYAKTAAITIPLRRNSEFIVSIMLREKDSGQSEVRWYLQQFKEGGAVIDWKKGDPQSMEDMHNAEPDEIRQTNQEGENHDIENFE
jgi:hypothetical protein